VFEKLVGKILDLLDGKKSPDAGRERVSRHEDVVRQLTGVTAFDGLLDALAALDGLVCAYVTAELARYSPTVKIADQEDRSRSIAAQARVLFEVYQAVLRDPAAAKHVAAPVGDLATVAGRMVVDSTAASADKSVRMFLDGVRGFVLLSLWVSGRSGVGAQLITALAQANAAITIRIFYRSDSASLLAFPAGTGPYAKAGTINPTDDIRGRTKPVTKGTGAPSDLGAPVWLTGAPKTAGELLAASFKYQSVDEALAKILIGSISFTAHRAPFFTPARIELMHELIHVLHNARGSNREKVNTLKEDEVAAFKDAEEYWTIVGGTINENALNATIGAPDRWGHNGLTLAALDPKSDAAAISFREHVQF